jgi:enoyl-CoA hydratase
MPDPEYRHLTYESFDDGAIVRIMLDRPEYKNAQHRALLVELDDAFMRAETDDTVRVVILGGHGTMFSSGHDTGTPEAREDQFGAVPHPTRTGNGATRETAVEQILLQEWHYFFENTLRWRNLRKITVAQVHGAVYAAGLMLMWACDLIVAAEDTRSPTSSAPASGCAAWSTSRTPGSSDPARRRSSCSPATPSTPRRRTASAW